MGVKEMLKVLKEKEAQIKAKIVIGSNDGGKTWNIDRVDYVTSNINPETERFQVWETGFHRQQHFRLLRN